MYASVTFAKLQPGKLEEFLVIRIIRMGANETFLRRFLTPIASKINF